MSIDLSEFYEVFFEECYEGLDIMESGLVKLDLGAADPEAINTIFRAAHSIKGGSVLMVTTMEPFHVHPNGATLGSA